MNSTSARKKVSNIAVVELNSIDICKFIRFRAIKLIEKINIIDENIKVLNLFI